jgi:putative oxygen-independent coproporphyrinogen III oxidase
MNPQDPPGLYVHVPFCRTRCPYCDFYSNTSVSLIPAWLEALEREAELYSGRFFAFDSLFLGGGTPSLLDDRQIASLFRCLTRHFRFAGETEISIEVNPDDVTRERLRLFRELGINRVSVGAQSFNEDELRFLRRRHTAEGTARALDLIRSEGFSNLSLDLIYGFEAPGLRGKHFETWAETLRQALHYRPEHLSCYQMTVEDGTPLSKMRELEKFRMLDEEEERELFLFTSRFLEEHGYTHYEVSNFARSPSSMCRHNLKYWRHVPYLGLGPSAHSFDGLRRWWNVRSTGGYCRSLAEGKPPTEGSETLTGEQLRLEHLFLGSRTMDGFGLDLVQDRSNYEAVLSNLREEGLVELTGSRIVPTRTGYLVADSLPLLFAD